MKKIIVRASSAAAWVLFTGWPASAAPQNFAQIWSQDSNGKERPLVTKMHSALPTKTDPKDCGATAGGGPVVSDQLQETAKSTLPSEVDRRD